ncbi:hypothetical protein AAFF_G00278610 [Aldrovandia affinis]|uniref:Uncharacterized protein n=1 Tax=Aldrovandia affinis TaxID=143900 RepID=A0AAD7SSB8_9TELE|nr:hypothetical protein AAFF_G00278610 [Aldrovandia affinis]
MWCLSSTELAAIGKKPGINQRLKKRKEPKQVYKDHVQEKLLSDTYGTHREPVSYPLLHKLHCKGQAEGRGGEESACITSLGCQDLLYPRLALTKLMFPSFWPFSSAVVGPYFCSAEGTEAVVFLTFLGLLPVVEEKEKESGDSSLPSLSGDFLRFGDSIISLLEKHGDFWNSE